MRIVIAPQGFKGSLGPWEAARAIQQGTNKVFPNAETVLIPVADGGNGTLEVLVGEDYGSYLHTQVSGPLDEKILASWGIMNDKNTVVIESAQACGLTLLSTKLRDPLKTTSRGVGELIKSVIEMGYRNIVLGVGGTATNDGGVGMAQALGIRFFDKYGQDLPSGGGPVIGLKSIDFSGLDPRVAESEITVALDVLNPLCGPEGATKVYGPQKGADPTSIVVLEKGLERLSTVIDQTYGIDTGDFPGAGSGGGLGAGLKVFLGARCVPGGQLICERLNIYNQLDGADLVIVGEGSIDYQTMYGKAPMVVASYSVALGIPVLGISGKLGLNHEALYQNGFNWLASINDLGVGEDNSMKFASHFLELATGEALQRIKSFIPKH
jgi:glycerate kinase